MAMPLPEMVQDVTPQPKNPSMQPALYEMPSKPADKPRRRRSRPLYASVSVPGRLCLWGDDSLYSTMGASREVFLSFNPNHSRSAWRMTSARSRPSRWARSASARYISSVIRMGICRV